MGWMQSIENEHVWQLAFSQRTRWKFSSKQISDSHGEVNCGQTVHLRIDEILTKINYYCQNNAGWLQGFQPTSLSLESRTSPVSSFPDSDSNYIMSPSRRVDSTKTGDRKLPSGEDRLQVSNRLGQLIIRIRIVQWPRWVGIRSPPVRPLLCYSH